MKELAKNICEVMADYHYSEGFKLRPERVLDWVSQFDNNDQYFILQEFLHLLNQGIYVSEANARKKIIDGIGYMATKYKFPDIPSFLAHADFLKMQGEGKSQDIMLRLVDDELHSFGIGLDKCGGSSKKYAIYIDDILATGKTVLTDCIKWLEAEAGDGESNFDKVIKKEKILTVYELCMHAWPNINWSLKMHFKNDSILDKIQFVRHFFVENHYRRHDQRFNLVYPTANQPEVVLEYLESLPATNHRDLALRKEGMPTKEEFFSSRENRIRFENIILLKGIDILKKSSTLSANHRPLGVIYPSYKTLGTGTLFFTWRNVSNTTPIVFWWGAHWKPLFPLKGRGN